MTAQVSNILTYFWQLRWSVVRRYLQGWFIIDLLAALPKEGCSVLQCVAVCCSVLQCVAVCGSAAVSAGLKDQIIKYSCQHLMHFLFRFHTVPFDVLHLFWCIKVVFWLSSLNAAKGRNNCCNNYCFIILLLIIKVSIDTPQSHIHIMILLYTYFCHVLLFFMSVSVMNTSLFSNTYICFVMYFFHIYTYIYKSAPFMSFWYCVLHLLS